MDEAEDIIIEMTQMVPEAIDLLSDLTEDTKTIEVNGLESLHERYIYITNSNSKSKCVSICLFICHTLALHHNKSFR